MNPAHCPQCGRAVSEADRAGGSCPWCGRALVAVMGQPPTSRHRHTPATSTSNGRSAWSYWWIPIVALMALRGVTSCHRMSRESHKTYTTPEYRFSPPPTTFDRERIQELIERIQQDDARWRELQADYDSLDDNEVRPGEAARRLFGVSETDDEAPSELDEDWMPVAAELRRHREALERGPGDVEESADSQEPDESAPGDSN